MSVANSLRMKTLLAFEIVILISLFFSSLGQAQDPADKFKIVRDDLKKYYDQNQDGSLSMMELEGAPAFYQGQLMSYYLESKKLDLGQVADFFLKIPLWRAPRVFSYLESKDQLQVLKMIIEKDPSVAAEYLFRNREDAMNTDPVGTAAKKILNQLTNEEKILVSDQIRLKNDGFYEAIQKLNSYEQFPVGVRTARELKDSDNENTPSVGQREYLITNAKNFSKIQTHGVGPCIALSLYDKKTKTGMLAHFDAPAPVYDSLDRIFQEFTIRKININRLEARILGGEKDARPDWTTNQRHLYKLKRYLTDAGVKIVFEDSLRPEVGQYELDLNTGEVYDYIEKVKSLYQTVSQTRLFGPNGFSCVGLMYRHPNSLPNLGVNTGQNTEVDYCVLPRIPGDYRTTYNP